MTDKTGTPPSAAAAIATKSESIATVLPSHIDPALFIRVAQGVVRRDTKLADAATRNFPSFMSALMHCARLGLEPGETFHLIPFEDRKNHTVEIQGIVDYKGEIELIYRAGAVGSVTAELVHSNDTFSYLPGVHDRPQHQIDWFRDRGDLIGVYAYAVMNSGAISRVVVMGPADIAKIQAESKGANRADSPWKKWPERMWLKSAVHQLYKWVPSSPEYLTELLRAKAAAATQPALAPAGPVAIPAAHAPTAVPATAVEALPATTGDTEWDLDPEDIDLETGEILETEKR